MRRLSLAAVMALAFASCGSGPPDFEEAVESSWTAEELAIIWSDGRGFVYATEDALSVNVGPAHWEAGSREHSEVVLDGVGVLMFELGFNSATWTRMQATRAPDGDHTVETDDLTLYWDYDATVGLFLTFIPK